MKGSTAFVVIMVTLEYGCDGGSRTPLTLPSLPTSQSPTRSAPLVDLTGSYELTLVASPSCSTVTGTDPLTHQTVPFPELALTRTYPAQVIPGAVGYFQIVLRRGECDRCTPGRRWGAMDATVNGRELRFSAGSVPGSTNCAGDDEWWEPLSSDREWFEVCGDWQATVDDPSQIAGTHVGTFAYYHQVDPSTSLAAGWVNIACSATDHHFSLTRTMER